MKLTREKLVEIATIAFDEWADPQHKCPHIGCPYVENHSIHCSMCRMIEVVLRECGDICGPVKITREKLIEMGTAADDEWRSSEGCPHSKCPYQESRSIYCEMCYMIEVILRGCGEDGDTDD